MGRYFCACKCHLLCGLWGFPLGMGVDIIWDGNRNRDTGIKGGIRANFFRISFELRVRGGVWVVGEENNPTITAGLEHFLFRYGL